MTSNREPDFKSHPRAAPHGREAPMRYYCYYHYYYCYHYHYYYYYYYYYCYTILYYTILSIVHYTMPCRPRALDRGARPPRARGRSRPIMLLILCYDHYVIIAIIIIISVIHIMSLLLLLCYACYCYVSIVMIMLLLLLCYYCYYYGNMLSLLLLLNTIAMSLHVYY